MSFDEEIKKYGPIGKTAREEGQRVFDQIMLLEPGKSLEVMSHLIDDYFRYTYNEFKGERPGDGFEKWVDYLKSEDIIVSQMHGGWSYVFAKRKSYSVDSWIRTKGKIHQETYTRSQLIKMMQITRSWTLRNPSGPLPSIPVSIELALHEDMLQSTLPGFKKMHWLMKLLMKLKVL